MLNIGSSPFLGPLDSPNPKSQSIPPEFLSSTSIRIYRTAIFCALLSNLGGCGSFNPVPINQVPFKERSQAQESEDLIITVSVLSNEETEQVFGMPLADQGIQPVWIKIKNKSSKPYWLMTATVDFDYFTPIEIAYPYHGAFYRETNKKIDRFLQDQHFDWYIKPGAENSGFVYTNLSPGFKYLNIGIYSLQNYETFQFTAEVPGLEIDYTKVDFDALYGGEYTELTEEELRQALREFPCCTTNAEGSAEGDPLNLVVIGSNKEVGYAFTSREWSVTETIHGNSIWKTIKSSVFGNKYRTSPVSPLYVFGRPQDIAFQKTRKTVNERNHLRLWRTPWLYNGEHVSIGQISRDVGIKFTMKSPTISTHKVDADVDEARNYLLQDLVFSQHVKKFGLVQGVGKTRLEEGRENLTGDPYFTDGLRVVLELTEEPTTINQIERLDWEHLIDHYDKHLGH